MNTISKQYQRTAIPHGSLRELHQQIRKLIRKSDCKSAIQADYELPGSLRQNKPLTASDLDGITDFAAPLASLTLHYSWGSSSKLIVVFLSWGSAETVHVAISAEQAAFAAKVCDLVSSSLNLRCVNDDSAGESSEFSRERSLLPKIDSGATLQLPPSDKITLKWMAHNVPIKFWVWAIGIVAVAFSTGFSLGMKFPR